MSWKVLCAWMTCLALREVLTSKQANHHLRECCWSDSFNFRINAQVSGFMAVR